MSYVNVANNFLTTSTNLINFVASRLNRGKKKVYLMFCKCYVPSENKKKHRTSLNQLEYA